MTVIEAQIAKMLAYGHFTRELMALYIHRIIAHASAAAVGAFTVVFIYQTFGDSLLAALIAFGAMYLGTGLLSVPAAKLLARFGIRTLIIASLPIMTIGNVALFFVATGRVAGEGQTIAAVAVFVAAAIGYRILYWIPYNTDMSLLLDDSRRGTQVALLSNLADVNVAAMPFWAGIIVSIFGFGWLFLFATALTLVSMIPLFWIENRHERYSWTYLQTLRVLFRPETRPLLWGYTATGIQDSVQIVVWPLMVFVLLEGEYVALGAITALTFFAILLIRFLAGRWFDAGKKTRALEWGALLSASGWILKMTVVSPASVFLVDTYHGVGRVMNHTAIDIFAFEQAADNGRFVDEYTVLKEMALALGRTSVLILTGVAAFAGGMYAGFAVALTLAAAATFGTIMLARRVSFTAEVPQRQS